MGQSIKGRGLLSALVCVVVTIAVMIEAVAQSRYSNICAAWCSRPGQPAQSYCCDRIYIADIENAFSFSLRNIILFESHHDKRKLLDSTTFNASSVAALSNFLGLTVQYMKSRLQDHTLRFITNIHTITDTEVDLTSEKLLMKLNAAQTNTNFISPHFQPSVSCHQSDRIFDTCLPHFWVYTCGLWKILHTLTHAPYTETPRKVLEIIKEFVIYHHGCPDCEHHFRHTYTQTLDTLPKKAISHDDAILWLWCTHNSVNQRITNRITTEHLTWHPHPQFPLNTTCPECWTQEPTTNCKELFCNNVAHGPGTCFQTPDDEEEMVYHNFNKGNVLQNLAYIYSIPNESTLYEYKNMEPLNLFGDDTWTTCPSD